MAVALGRQLGDPVGLTENYSNTWLMPQGLFGNQIGGLLGNGNVPNFMPIAPGEFSIRASVRVTYQLR
jgi:hypothetical protein